MKQIIILFSLIFFNIACSNKNLIHTSKNEQEIDIRVMAYNVHHCNPPGKPNVIDIDGIAAVINQEKPDLVALQEIDVNTIRSGKFNQAEELAKRTGMKFFFGKGIDYEGGEYGVAILSKYELSEPKVNKLPTLAGTKGEPRTLTTAIITLPTGHTLRFGSTHLDAQKANTNRELQIKEIIEIASSENLPFIIAGDFNAAPGSTVINVLDSKFTRTCQQCEPTIPIVNPNKTIDFIAFTPPTKFRVISTKVINGIDASDHLPVVAELKLFFHVK